MERMGGGRQRPTRFTKDEGDATSESEVSMMIAGSYGKIKSWAHGRAQNCQSFRTVYLHERRPSKPPRLRPPPQKPAHRTALPSRVGGRLRAAGGAAPHASARTHDAPAPARLGAQVRDGLHRPKGSSQGAPVYTAGGTVHGKEGAAVRQNRLRMHGGVVCPVGRPALTGTHKLLPPRSKLRGIRGRILALELHHGGSVCWRVSTGGGAAELAAHEREARGGVAAPACLAAKLARADACHRVLEAILLDVGADWRHAQALEPERPLCVRASAGYCGCGVLDRTLSGKPLSVIINTLLRRGGRREGGLSSAAGGRKGAWGECCLHQPLAPRHEHPHSPSVPRPLLLSLPQPALCQQEQTKEHLEQIVVGIGLVVECGLRPKHVDTRRIPYIDALGNGHAM